MSKTNIEVDKDNVQEKVIDANLNPIILLLFAIKKAITDGNNTLMKIISDGDEKLIRAITDGDEALIKSITNGDEDLTKSIKEIGASIKENSKKETKISFLGIAIPTVVAIIGIAISTILTINTQNSYAYISKENKNILAQNNELKENYAFVLAENENLKKEIIPVSGVSLDGYQDNIKIKKSVLKTDGKYYKNKVPFKALITPANATIQDVIWVSSDETVATINRDTGELITQGYGKTTIRVTTVDGEYTATCIVTVSDY